MVSRCGSVKIHHWAHKTGGTCDKWWESESEWHLKWKGYFPEDWREEVKHDQATGEKHIADVFNPNLELVIEFQNSPLSIGEMKSREAFYKKMIWIVNAQDFDFRTSSLDEWNEDVGKLERKLRRNALKIHQKPSYELHEKNFLAELELQRIRKAQGYGGISKEEAAYRIWKAENEILRNKLEFYKDAEDEASNALRMYLDDMELYRKKNENRDFEDLFIQYFWSRRREVWSQASLPVFFDLGGEIVWIKSPYVAKRVPLNTFISKYGVMVTAQTPRDQ